jgi:hypothetical protein
VESCESTPATRTFVDQRGTLNRAGRSGRQAPQTNLTQSQIANLIGIRDINGTTYYIDPKIINPSNGRGAAAFGQPSFAGQVFFDNGPGETGSLQRATVNGPLYSDIDLVAIKNIRIKESVRLQLRAEVFNFLNHTNFYAGDSSGNGLAGTGNIFNVNTTTFGQITDTYNHYLNGGLNRVMQLAARFEF